MKQKTRWLRLDNAAKIYPAVRSETWSNVFRVSATLSEPVDIPTAQSALDLVDAGVGIAFIPETCIQERPGIRFIPIENWHQALYMCIYYDKWLEPPVWEFVELLVKNLRDAADEDASPR